MFRKVFISYAREDFETAEKLYKYLSEYRYEPWMNKKEFLPGQNWDIEIRTALRRADFIIVLLSKISVGKRGYIQKEFKLALEYCEEKLEDDIYIISCKINNCITPEKLEKYHWIELNKPDSFDLILSALNLQRNKCLELERQKITNDVSYKCEEVKINKTAGEILKRHAEVVFPQFSDKSTESLDHLNSFIKSNVITDYSRFIHPFVLFEEDEDFNDILILDHYLTIDYRIEFMNGNFISYTISQYAYAGGAHGMYNTTGYNYQIDPLIEVGFEELLDHNPTALKLDLFRFENEEYLAKVKEMAR